MPINDPIKSAEYKHKWYLENIVESKKRAYLYQIVARRRNFDLVNKIKIERGCKDCGLKDPRCLDFDHLPGYTKKNTITALSNMGLSIKSLMEEINKCEVRCANCHRIITHVRRHQKKNVISLCN